MKVPLNRELIQAVIAQRFGTVPKLAEAWADRVDEGKQREGTAPSLKTVYRWLREALMPSKSEALFGLAGTVDVDPVALLDLKSERFVELYLKERRLFQMGVSYYSALSPFRSIYLTAPEWPNNDVANAYHGRPWYLRGFLHDPNEVMNVYAAVCIEALAPDPKHPRTYHFAYRRSGDPEETWRPYGTVIGYDGEVLLFSDRGDRQWEQDNRSPRSVVVETYFGAGPAEFRVASLHDFELKLEAPSRETQAVQFVA